MKRVKRRLKMKNRSHKYNTNKLRPRQRHKYTKWKICLVIVMVICIKEYLSNIWSLIYEKIMSLSWKKSVAYKKAAKKIPAQVFSCEFCGIFRKIYFPEHFQTDASEGLEETQNYFGLLMYLKLNHYGNCECNRSYYFLKFPIRKLLKHRIIIFFDKNFWELLFSKH